MKAARFVGSPILWAVWVIGTVVWAGTVLSDWRGHEANYWYRYHTDYKAVEAEHRAAQAAALRADQERRDLAERRIQEAMTAERNKLADVKMEQWLKDSMVHAAGEAQRRREQEPAGYIMGHPVPAFPSFIDVNSPPPRPTIGWLEDLLGPPALAVLMVLVGGFAAPVIHALTARANAPLRIKAAVSLGWVCLAALFLWVFAEHMYRYELEKVAALLLLPPVIGWGTHWLVKRAASQQVGSAPTDSRAR